MESTLFILDQHAVDERIQLEKLLELTFGISNDKMNFGSEEVDFEWTLTPYELEILHDYMNRVKQWGIKQ